MANVLITLAEDAENTVPNKFATKYSVDEHDCIDFAKGLETLDHQVNFVNWADFNGTEFDRMFDWNNHRFYEESTLIDDHDLIFVYKMEGFLNELPRFFGMVERFAKSGAIVVNDPRTIEQNISKEYLMMLQDKGIRTLPTHYVRDIESKLGTGKTFVIKPKFGDRGGGQFLASNPGDLDALREANTIDKYLAQDFCPEGENGERDLSFVGFDYCHAIMKIPAPGGDFRSNESLGAAVSG